MESSGPKFWMAEESGVLAPVVKSYLNNEELNPFQISLFRAYLQQWIDADCWEGRDVDDLRLKVRHLFSRLAIDRWLDAALEAGIDPL